MVLFQSQKLQKYCIGFLFVLCIIIPFWSLNQGIDLVDTGYEINMGNFLTTHPETTNYPMFLCAFISHIFFIFFEALHIPIVIGFKIAKIVFILGSDLLIYHIYKQSINRITLLLLLGGCNLILLSSSTMLSYNVIGNFLSTLFLYLIYKGECEKKLWKYALAGTVYTLNIFVRLPNVVQGVASIAILLTVLWEKDKKRVLYKMLCFSAGILAGLFFTLILIHIYIGIPAYLHAIRELFVYAESDDTIYNLPEMLRTLFSEGVHGTVKFVKLALPVAIGGIILYWPAKLSFFKKRPYIIYGIVIAVLAVHIYTDYEYRQPIGWIQLLVASAAIMGVIISCRKSIPDHMRFLSAVSVLLLISMPIGSSTRFYFFLNNGFQVFMPVIFYFFYTCPGKKYYKAMGGCIVGIMFLIIGSNVIEYKYGDYESERQLVLNDPSNYLNGTITGTNRQETILDLEIFLETYDGDISCMIVLGDAPLLHSILNIPPFFPDVNGWTDLAQLDLNKIKNTFDHKSCPLIIVNHENFYTEYPRMTEKRHIFFDELLENAYMEIYRNSKYTIYQYQK